MNQYNEQQLAVLNQAKEKGYDISHLVGPEFNSLQLKVLADAYRDNLNLSLLLNPNFSAKHMSIIFDTQRMLLNHSNTIFTDRELLLLITPLCNPKYSIPQLERLSQGLKNGYNITPVAKPEYSEGIMKEYFRGCYQGVDLSPYLNNSEQELAAVRRYLMLGYEFPAVMIAHWHEYSEDQFWFLIKNISQGNDITNYVDQNLSIEEMKELKNTQVIAFAR